MNGKLDAENEKLCVVYYGVSLNEPDEPRYPSPNVPVFPTKEPEQKVPATQTEGECYEMVPIDHGRRSALQLNAVAGQALRFYAVKVKKNADDVKTVDPGLEEKQETAQKALNTAKAAEQLTSDRIKAFAGMSSEAAGKEVTNLTAQLGAERATVAAAQDELKKASDILNTARTGYNDAIKKSQRLVVLRAGTIPLGKNARPIYYSLVDHSGVNPQVPYSLLRFGDFPILTTDNDLSLVILNHRKADAPFDFTLSYSVDKGAFIDVAPVQPSLNPASLASSVATYNLKFDRESPVRDKLYLSLAYVDRAMPFSKKFPGESITKVTVNALATVTTEDKTTVSGGDETPSKTVETKIVKILDSDEWPQIHSLYHFNLSTGVVATFLRDPSFSRVVTVAPVYGDSDKTVVTDPARYGTIGDKGSPRAMPILAFSAYLKPKDVQVPFTNAQRFDWGNLAPTVGFSLKSPADDFFFGLTSEIVRNVHVIYGYHYGNITSLVPVVTDDPHSSAAPNTIKRFDGNVFFGLTFNVNFISALFK